MAEAWRKGFLPQAKRASGKRFGALYSDCSVWTAHRPRTAIRVWSHKLKSHYPRPGLAAEKARIYLHEIYRSTAPDLWKPKSPQGARCLDCDRCCDRYRGGCNPCFACDRFAEKRQ